MSTIIINKDDSLITSVSAPEDYGPEARKLASGKTAAPGSAAAKSLSRKSGRLFVLIGAPILTAIGLFYIYAFNPVTQKILFFPCPVYFYTGLYCPGCGNTRALHALVHFDLAGMLDYNLLFPFLFVILGWLLTGEYLNLLLGRRVLWLPKQVHPVIIALSCLAVAAFTILRNVPVFPFTILAP